MKKETPKTTKEWLKYLTIERYFTVFEIERRREIIENSGCDYIEIKAKILEYRNKNKNVIWTFENKEFYITDTFKLRQNIELIKVSSKQSPYKILIKEYNLNTLARNL